jgi:hypothetical protein
MCPEDHHQLRLSIEGHQVGGGGCQKSVRKPKSFTGKIQGLAWQGYRSAGNNHNDHNDTVEAASSEDLFLVCCLLGSDLF